MLATNVYVRTEGRELILPPLFVLQFYRARIFILRANGKAAPLGAQRKFFGGYGSANIPIVEIVGRFGIAAQKIAYAAAHDVERKGSFFGEYFQLFGKKMVHSLQEK